MKKLFVLVFAFLFISSLKAQTDLPGDWSGAISIMGVELGMLVHFKAEGETYSATIDIPEQGAKGLKLSNVVYSVPVISFELEIPEKTAKFKGAVDNDSITGDFKQAGLEGKFYLTKGLKKEVEVVEKKNFNEEEVTFKNGDISFAGTLSLPLKKGKHPAVVMITGSGPQNRDENVAGFKIFKVIADYLTTNGVAVLRYDDRGVGGSKGKNVDESTTEEFSTDVMAAMDFLKRREDINPGQIGLIGHSEGGIVAPMVAAKNNDVAFIVCVAGPSVTGAEIIAEQTKLILLANGGDKEKVERGVADSKFVLNMFVKGASDNEIKDAIRKVKNEEYDKLSEDEKGKITDRNKWVEDDITTNFNAFNSPWMRYFLKFDPVTVLEKTKCPALMYFGGLDLQVPVSQNEGPTRVALIKAGNKDFEIKVFDKANHLFQEAGNGSPMEYGKLKKSFVDGFLEFTSNWILKRVTVVK
ncbi:MAG: alpha/beta fold hydrolase [Ignavibacteriota bacterium]